jgi:UPF0755 protein
VIIFLATVLVLLAALVGGGYLAWQRLSAGPKISIGEIPIPTDGGIEKQLTGLYLQFRQAELETPVNASGAPVAFVVEPGQTAGDIGAALQRDGLISDASLFRMLVKYYDLGSRLEAGEYQLSPAMTMMEIAETLQHGRLREMTITIPEGWRLEQIAEYLEKQGIATQVEFMALAAQPWTEFEFLRDRPAGASLEGYLFPDTYRIGPSFGAREVITVMLENFDRRVPPDMRAQAEGLTLHQLITLASVVEREAVIADERPIIAAVFLNRMDARMYLGACSTVQYSKGIDAVTGKWWSPITLEETRSVASPYNTYANLGLPPGPICNPGLDAIRAALNPADTDYLYFVLNDVKGDGSHVFSRTYEEHLANQAKYQR